MKSRYPLFLALVVIVLLAACAADDPVIPRSRIPAAQDDDTAAASVLMLPSTFVGSEACAWCHYRQHANWSESGHPYMLTKVEGVSPVDAFPAVSAFAADPIDPPAGYTWDDISYAIGGYGWKMLWLDDDGYLITGAGDTQYNFENRTRAAFGPDDPPGTRPYDCGRCHATGWEDSDNGDATDNQGGLGGLVGTFVAGGVHCEACHGMGSRHIFAAEQIDMIVDRSPELCARCHRLEADNSILAADGFIRNGQQYTEWLHSPHNAPGAPGCNDCHDPHSSVKFDATAAGSGTTTACTDCHFGFEGPGNHPPDASCEDCHMAKAVKSAISLAENKGDVRSHIINTTVALTDSMFNEAGDRVRLDENGWAAITIEFTCLACHSPTRDGDDSVTWSRVLEFMQGERRIHAPAVLPNYSVRSVE
jgi:hypothetical protein